MKEMLIPVQSLEMIGGKLSLPASVRLSAVNPDDRFAVSGLIEELGAIGVEARWSGFEADGLVVVRRDRSVSQPEGYVLVVGLEGIEIRSGTSTGVFYGVQTLRDLIRQEGRSLPCCRIEDHPALNRRGVYHDCSRGKVPTVETVKALAERLSRWKINELQLYVENVFTFSAHPGIGRGYSPYTPDDILSMKEHCRRYHIDFVPSLTSLGHFEKILKLPEYLHLAELPGYLDHAGGTTLCPTDPGSITLVADMYREFVPLFDSNEFNVCGDEPWELGEGRSRQRAEEIGKGRVYLEFILALRRLCLEHGKRMNLWGDIVMKHPEIIPELPRDIVILNWDYNPHGTRLARSAVIADAGLSFVCCPGTHGWQSHGTRLGRAMENITRFADAAVRNGAEGLLNTDWGDAGHRNMLGASLAGMAIGAACSWAPAKVDATDFVERFADAVFGDPGGQVASGIRRLGDDDFGYWAYHVLLESLREPKGLGEGDCRTLPRAEEVTLSDEAVREKGEAMQALSFLPAAGGQAECSFEDIALAELDLAAKMNHAACQRLGLIRQIRKAGVPEAVEISAHRDLMVQLSAELPRVWRLRNRESRLADNVKGLSEAIDELGSLG